MDEKELAKKINEQKEWLINEIKNVSMTCEQHGLPVTNCNECVRDAIELGIKQGVNNEQARLRELSNFDNNIQQWARSYREAYNKGYAEGKQQGMKNHEHDAAVCEGCKAKWKLATDIERIHLIAHLKNVMDLIADQYKPDKDDDKYYEWE